VNPPRLIALAVLLSAAIATSAIAQDTTSSTQDASQDGSPHTSRLFGVLPNSSTVEPGTPFVPVTTRQVFYFATDDSFDKAVYPFVAVVAFFGVGQSDENYLQRYATSFADNTLGNYMVTAIFPTLFKQDPRYFVLGRGNFFLRAGYAASRIVVTKSRDGHAVFNISEIGGDLSTASVATLYYPSTQRTAKDVLVRASSQVIWDAVAFESKEFWPDIRRAFERMFHRP
jgi:hypothetical protein